MSIVVVRTIMDTKSYGMYQSVVQASNVRAARSRRSLLLRLAQTFGRPARFKRVTKGNTETRRIPRKVSGGVRPRSAPRRVLRVRTGKKKKTKKKTIKRRPATVKKKKTKKYLR